MYFIVINNEQAGPFSMDQLKEQIKCGNLTKQTYVWKEGMANWEFASQVDEVNKLFVPTPPPIPGMPPAVPVMPSKPSIEDVPLAKVFIANCIDYVDAKGSYKKDLETIIKDDINTLICEMRSIVSKHKTEQEEGKKLCMALVNGYADKIDDCDCDNDEGYSVGDVFTIAAGYLALYSDKKDLSMEFLRRKEAVAYTLTVGAIEDYWNGNIEDAYDKLSKVCADDELDMAGICLVPLVSLYGYILEKAGYEFELSFNFMPFSDTLDVYQFELENQMDSTPSISWSERDVKLLKEMLNQ